VKEGNLVALGSKTVDKAPPHRAAHDTAAERDAEPVHLEDAIARVIALRGRKAEGYGVDACFVFVFVSYISG